MDGTQTRSKNTTRQWRVFVSSTGFGLGGFRDAARDVIKGFRYDGRRYFEPVMMENFGAVDGPAREVCADRVRNCDLLVGIVGIRYGDHPPDDQTSFTEIEFRTAVERELPRLMYLLDENVARGLEGGSPQGEDRADRQRQFRRRVAVDRVSDITVDSVEVFKKALRSALKNWIEDDSFKLAMVDHSAEFRQARTRLLDAAEQTGGAMLIFGAPGTGKTKLFDTLLNDVRVRRAYRDLIGPHTVRLAGGKDAVERVRTDVNAKLEDLARQQGVSRALLPSALIALYLESDLVGGKEVDEGTLAALGELFTWDVPRAVITAETNSLPVLERLESDLGWDSGAVITVRDYDSVSDALEQMRRDAPDVRTWPQPDTQVLAEALGLRPVTLYAAAKEIESVARRSPRQVPARIHKQLEAIADETSPEGKHAALIRTSIENLSQEAKDLLALMTVLHPKPTLFPDQMAVALNLSLDLDQAVAIATAEDDSDLDEDQLARRNEADELIAELVDHGLLERTPKHGPVDTDSPELLTLHPANVRVIHDHLPLTEEKRAAGHARAEAFYRSLVGEAVSGSFDERFRMEDGDWWDHAEEWIYHFAHLAPARAGITFAALFLDAYWWWDLYVRFDFCDRLLDYARRPRVQAVNPEMSKVATLLAKFRDTYPQEHESALAKLYAEIAGGGPERAADLRRTATKGAGVLDVLRDLCGRLGITELDGLFEGPVPEPDDASAPEDETRLHLLGLICLFLAEGHRFRAELEPDGTGLAAAEACYKRAESYFLAEEDGWDVAWTRYLLGEVVSERGGDPDPLWDLAEDAAGADSDTELLANIERARGDHLRARGDLDDALAHYGRAVFYGVALQVTSNLESGADPYTQALYREMQLNAVKMLAEPVLHAQASSRDAGGAEASRRLTVMLGEWGGSWQPDQAKLDKALGEATREEAEESAAAIAGAAFPPGPGDAVLGEPDSDYYREVNDRIERTVTQPWVKGFDRWAKHHKKAAE